MMLELPWEGWITIPKDDTGVLRLIEGISVTGVVRESDTSCRTYTIKITEERAWDKLDKHWGRWIWGPKR